MSTHDLTSIIISNLTRNGYGFRFFEALFILRAKQMIALAQ